MTPELFIAAFNAAEKERIKPESLTKLHTESSIEDKIPITDSPPLPEPLGLDDLHAAVNLADEASLRAEGHPSYGAHRDAALAHADAARLALKGAQKAKSEGNEALALQLEAAYENHKDQFNQHSMIANVAAADFKFPKSGLDQLR
jgi:hypothetical protein